MTTPNMSLSLPIVSTTIGPTWASELNTALELVDEHDHSSGSGVRINPSGLNINATLEINSNDLTEINSLALDNRTTAPTTSRSVYAKSGDLYYRNNSGVEVQVTNGPSIAGVTGSITGLGDGGSSAIFSNGNEDFSWYFNSTKLAAFNMGDLRLFPFDGSAAYTFAVTLKSPTTLASSYSLTLPGTAPTQNGIWSVATTGIIQNGAHDGTAAAPSLYFNSDVNTGVYWVGADQIGFSTGGTLRHTISTTAETLTLPILGQLGSASAPAYSFSGDTNSGVYGLGSDEVGIAAAGALSASFASTYGMRIVSGSASTPTVSFTADPDTGMYSASANEIGFTTDSTLRTSIGTYGHRTLVGSASTPSIAFIDDPDTGIYRSGANNLAVTCGGAQVAEFGTSAGALTLSQKLQFGGDGAFKVKIFSGTLAASTTVDLTISGTIIGACGWATGSSSVYHQIYDDSLSSGITSANIFYDNTTDGATARLRNRSATNSRTYTVAIIYQ